MIDHVTDIQTQFQSDPDGKMTGIMRYRWRCSCGAQGRWFTGSRESGSHAEAGRSAREACSRHELTGR